MVKAVLFDIDGVIIRHKEYYSRHLERIGYVEAAAVLDEFYSSGTNQECDRGLLDPLVAIVPFLKRMKFDKRSDEYFNAQYEIEKQYIDYKLLERIKSLRANGVRCFLATNQNTYRKVFLHSVLDVDNTFDYAFYSCDMYCVKPEKEYWEYILKYLEKYRFLPEELLFLDDTAANVESAEKHGIRAKHIRTEKDIADALISVN